MGCPPGPWRRRFVGVRPAANVSQFTNDLGGVGLDSVGPLHAACGVVELTGSFEDRPDAVSGRTKLKTWQDRAWNCKGMFTQRFCAAIAR